MRPRVGRSGRQDVREDDRHDCGGDRSGTAPEHGADGEGQDGGGGQAGHESDGALHNVFDRLIHAGQHELLGFVHDHAPVIPKAG